MRGPSDLSTAKLYTHVLDRGPGAVRSALELMSRAGGGHRLTASGEGRSL